ncbi:MAG: hypothetical protein JRM85_07780 [Nitrososphaerota archaeon]|nr:hypothetical protein [Nitrososphaerota archaeon]MDG6919223.1 hypothetical protein [Nitrososphaerota archaeon]
MPFAGPDVNIPSTRQPLWRSVSLAWARRQVVESAAVAAVFDHGRGDDLATRRERKAADGLELRWEVGLMAGSMQARIARSDGGS